MTKTLTPKGMKMLKFLHLLFTSAWFGGALIMNFLLLVGAPSESHEMYMRSRDIWFIDYMIVTPAAIGCVLTAVVYGVWTKWGFFKQRWLTVKWVLALFMVIAGTFVMAPCVDANVYAPELIHTYSPSNEDYISNVSTNLLWGSISMACFAVIYVVSVYKPKLGKKKQ